MRAVFRLVALGAAWFFGVSVVGALVVLLLYLVG